MKKLIISIAFFSLFLALCISVQAATLYGNVYSLDLEKQHNSIVSLSSASSSSKQTFVAVNGTYTFEVSPGEYVLDAKYVVAGEIKSKVSEKIKIVKEGNYVYDLILFPNLDEENDLMQQVEEENQQQDSATQDYLPIILFALGLIVLGLVIFVIWKYSKLEKKVDKEAEKIEVSDLASEVLAFIKHHGGRTTQKDIRQKFPSSEAKISLVISELQHKGVLERIKQGRGNIIFLKKK